jgi:hypothetical protein
MALLLIRALVFSLHSSQFLFVSRFLVTDPNSVLCLRPYRLANVSQLTKKSKSKLCYDRRSVDQFLLVSRTHLGIMTRFIFVWKLRVCWCGAHCRTRGRICLLQCTCTVFVYLHSTRYDLNVYTCTIYTRLLSVQAISLVDSAHIFQ